MLRRPPTQLTLTRDDLNAYTARRAERLVASGQTRGGPSAPSKQNTHAQSARPGANGWSTSAGATMSNVEDEDEDEYFEERDLDASIPLADAQAGSDDSDVDMESVADDTFDGRRTRGPAGEAFARGTIGAGAQSHYHAGQTQAAATAAQRSSASRRARIMGDESSRSQGAAMGGVPGAPRRTGGGC